MIKKESIPQLREFTKIPIRLFYIYGFCVFRWKPADIKNYWFFIFSIIFVLHVIVDISAISAYLIFHSLETSLEKTAYIIYCTFATNAMIKVACCYINLQKIRRVIKYFESYYPTTFDKAKDCNLEEHLQRIRKYNKSLTIYHFFVTSLFNWFPLVNTIIMYYQSEERIFRYDLPFPMVYPFSTNNFWGYAFAYTTQCSGSYIASCAFLGSDLLLITCVHLVNMNFAYLNNSIMKFKPDGTLNDKKKLKEFIIFHDDILRAVELIDDAFNISILLNYIGTATIICLLGFQLIAGTEFLDLIKFLSFLISVLTHVYFISLFGTEMITLSSNISEAFTHHSWYDGHIQYKRMLALPIARAQRPAQLHASKFFIISMETFKSLVSISYQFFTLIKTRYEEN